MPVEHRDVIGSGHRRWTMAWRLAQTGKRVPLVERRDYLPRASRHWNGQAVIVDGV